MNTHEYIIYKSVMINILSVNNTYNFLKLQHLKRQIYYLNNIKEYNIDKSDKITQLLINNASSFDNKLTLIQIITNESLKGIYMQELIQNL